MRKTLRFAGLFATMLWGGILSSWGQTTFTGSVTQEVADGYSTSPIVFSLTEVATALGTDAATLSSELDSYSGGTQGNLTIQLFYNGGEGVYDGLTEYSTSAPGGFWMDKDGNRTTWGATEGSDTQAMFYEDLYWSSTGDTLAFEVGQFPDRCEAGGDFTFEIRFTYNSSAYAIFDCTLTVNPAPEFDNELQLSNLTIVGTGAVSVTEHPRSTYNTDADSIAVADILPLLDLDAETFGKYLKNFIYTRTYNEGNEVWEDSINNDFTTSSTGFWFKQLVDEATQKKSSECYSTYTSSGDDASPFFAEFSTNAAGDTLIAAIGQNPDICAENSTYYGTIYLVHGSKAYTVTVTLNTDEKVQIPFADMEKAGEVSYTVEMLADNTSAESVTVDIDSIVSLLGITTDDIVLYGFSAENTLTNGSTANNGGYWFNSQGYVCAYGATDATMYIEPASSTDFSTLNVGKYTKTVLSENDSCTVALVILGESSYYQINVTLKIIPKPEVEGDLEIVLTQTYDVQLIASQGYSQVIDQSTSYTTQLDLDAIYKALDMSALTSTSLYTWDAEPEASWIPDSLSTHLTNTYSCTPHPGFWMSASGNYNYGWGSSCAYGMTLSVSSGAVTWYAFPSGTAGVTGASFTGNFFIVNLDNNKVARIIFNISYVEERVNLTEVGSESVTIITSDETQDDDGFYLAANDLSAAATALGIDISETASCTWYGKNASGAWVEIESFEGEDCLLNADGQVVSADADDAVYALGYDSDQGGFTASLLGADPSDDAAYEAKIALRYDQKLYTFTIVTGTEVSVGISNIATDSPAAGSDAYDLSGRLIRRSANASALPSGIYVIGGKKVIIR